MSQVQQFLLRVLGISPAKASVPSQSKDLSSLMQDLVMEQQRTMYYTVTMAPTPTASKSATPSLKVKETV